MRMRAGHNPERSHLPEGDGIRYAHRPEHESVCLPGYTNSIATRIASPGSSHPCFARTIPSRSTTMPMHEAILRRHPFAAFAVWRRGADRMRFVAVDNRARGHPLGV